MRWNIYLRVITSSFACCPNELKKTVVHKRDACCPASL